MAMGQREAIGLLDEAMDRARPALVPALAFLRELALEAWLADGGPADGEAAELCRGLPALCGEEPPSPALHARLRELLFTLCASVGNGPTAGGSPAAGNGPAVGDGSAAGNGPAFGDSTAAGSGTALARRRCANALRGLRNARKGMPLLAPALDGCGPETAAEEKALTEAQLALLRELYGEHLLIYRCAIRAGALALRQRYIKETEALRATLPGAEETGRAEDLLRVERQMTRERLENSTAPADIRGWPAFDDTGTAKGDEDHDVHHRAEPSAAGLQEKPPDHEPAEIPAEPAGDPAQ